MHTVKTPIIPVKQHFVKIEDQKAELDYKAICLFAATGFFLDDSTYWKNQKVLRPGTINQIDDRGYVLDTKSWFDWYYQPQFHTFEDALSQFKQVFEQIITEQTTSDEVILPLSGGLDSRCQAAVLHRLGKRVSSFSYSFQGGFKEHQIAEQIAQVCDFDFKAFQIKHGYLWDCIDQLSDINQCYSEFTHPRQMAFLKEYKKMNGVFSLGHWGDVFFSSPIHQPIADSTKYVQQMVVKKGGMELANALWSNWNLDGDFTSYLNDTIATALNQIEIPNFSAKIRAFKSKFWAPRWTSINLSVFENAHAITLPFYDDRMCKLICQLPETHLAERKLQIEYIKRYYPKLANIQWQSQAPYNLINFHNNKIPFNLPYRITNKLKRILKEKTGNKFIERNWELQFLGKENDKHLQHHLMHSDVNEFIEKKLIKEFYTKFKTKDQVYYSHSISMLLTLSVWWRKFGRN